MNDVNEKRVSIAMMTTFSGTTFKGPQMPEIINELERMDMLADGYGIWSSTDEHTYSKHVCKRLRASKMLRLFILVNTKLCKLLLNGKGYYTKNEKIYGMMARLHRFSGNIVIVKPRPSFLIKHLKRQGKIVIVEASENHARFTENMIKKECEDCGIPLVKNNFTKEKIIRDYENGIMLADFLICLSQFSANTYADYGIPREKIFVTGLDVGLEIKKEEIDLSNEITYICVANNIVLKGILRLVDVWNKYDIHNELHIIGITEEKFQEYGNNRNKNDKVKFLGRKSRNEIIDMYLTKKCVGVLLSVSESYGRVIHEALCCATPVITTETCTCDMVIDAVNGFIITNRDDIHIYDAINKFNQMKPQEFEGMRVAAYNSAKNRADQFKKNYIDAIRRVIEWEK